MVQGAFSTPSGDSQKIKVEKLEAEIETAREALSHWSADLAGYDAELSPVWDEQRRLERKIVATHAPRRLDLSRKAERRPLFAALDQLATTWGPTREKRRVAALEARLLAKEIEKLDRQRRVLSRKGATK